MGFFSKLAQALNFTMAGVDDAYRQSLKAILQGHLTYGGYRSAVTTATDLRSLPLFWLLDQRVRPKPASWATQAEIEAQLIRFLSVSNHPGALQLVTDALGLDPAYDASRLDRAREHSPAFVRFCLQGRLGWAIDAIPETGWPGFDRDAALELIADMLVYHAAFQVQLVAAGIWNVDNLFLALSWRSGRYDQNAALNDAENVAQTILSIGDHMLGRKVRYPNSNLVQSLKAQATRWRDDTGRPEDDLRAELESFYAQIEPYVADLLTNVKKAKHRLKAGKRGQPKGTSIYKAYFGVSANQALYFAVTGLCQLRRAAIGMVTAVADGDGTRAWLAWTEETIKLDDEMRAKLIFSWRSTLVRDHKAPALQDKTGQPIDLAREYALANYNIMPGKDLIDRAHSVMQGKDYRRFPVLSGAPTGVRRYDILPEYLLQFQMLPKAGLPKVPTLPQGPDAAAIRTKLLYERQRHQPDPRYYAPKRAPRP